MAHPVDAWLKQYMTPLLKTSGFRKQGRNYLREMPDGSMQYFIVQKLNYPVLPSVEFRIELVSAPKILLELFKQESYTSRRGLWEWKLDCPCDFQERFHHYDWVFDASDAAMAATLGARMEEKLKMVCIPLLDRLAEPVFFEEELRRPVWQLPGKTHPAALGLIIRQQRQSDEAYPLLRQAQLENPVLEIWPRIWTHLESLDGSSPSAAAVPVPAETDDEEEFEFSFTGSLVICKTAKSLDEVEALTSRDEGLEGTSLLPGGWQLGQYYGEDIEREIADVLVDLVAETGSPALSGFVWDSECVLVSAYSEQTGLWRACLDHEAGTQMLQEECDEDINDMYLPADQAAERALKWAQEAGLTPIAQDLHDVFHADKGEGQANKLFYDLTFALGIQTRQ
ncbi:hypothetical protein EH165_08030 [Nakamurella antarctica]|uniref:DUF4304 domain-containing protein n=1 Tax=Nakamurella antarctica TaxID=1902245 RepID=A0A3G8ZMS8_9ACTN|nr:hypothetical protein [Nakamurella antarctica]AZI58095.1 hypothetical protein EH165_08030 [Nakamurella antarctica]